MGMSIFFKLNYIKFDSGAYSIGIDASDPPSALVNKHSLETAGLTGIDSFSPTVKIYFHIGF